MRNLARILTHLDWSITMPNNDDLDFRRPLDFEDDSGFEHEHDADSPLNRFS